MTFISLFVEELCLSTLNCFGDMFLIKGSKVHIIKYRRLPCQGCKRKGYSYQTLLKSKGFQW